MRIHRSLLLQRKITWKITSTHFVVPYNRLIKPEEHYFLCCIDS